MAEKKRDDALAEMLKRRDLASEACVELYDKARDDVRFVTVPGAQWDEKLKARRGDRPTYEFPKLASHVRQVVNEMRQNRPQGKVRGTEEGDAGLAEIMQGLCRNIESVSNADQAYDIGYDFAVKGGFGAWRICTDYLNDEDFEQDIFIEPIRNPFAVKFDPAAIEIDRSDAGFAFVEELVSKDDFERRWPNASISDWEDNHDCVTWREKNQVLIAEYWYKDPIKVEMWALSNGAVVSVEELEKRAKDQGQPTDAATLEALLAAEGIAVTKRREVDSHVVKMRMTNGNEWLTEPYEFPSKFIPIIPCWGNITNIDGEDYWFGMVRPSKDQQRLHNVHRTAAIEAVAKAPKAPFIVKQSWIKGLERFWRNANAEDYPYLPVADSADMMPQRAAQAEIPAALLQLSALDNEDIKANTGIYDASLGARSNETSGRGILARQQQGATATFNYVDNFGYAIRYTYKILVDMIPRVYDTPRVVRVLGPDGGEKWKQLYQSVVDPRTGDQITLNDLSKGKYDVTITVGPSFATQRMEAVDAFTTLLGQMGPGLPPPIASLMAYSAIKNMDLPGMDDVDSAFRQILVSGGVLKPKDGEEAPEPQQPNPKDLADADKAAADADKSRAQTALYSADAQGKQLENMAAMSLMGLPPPNPAPMPEEQPPSGGFFMPESQGGYPA
ncbi:portal protein [Stenotrophomonas maltophilia]|uniref:Portal protein n=1 Tax=Stenotrophomonas maltophilia TaxID=40324 RepID=A0AAJ2MVN9_STEMA|nr:portal protein [Stenotrophomonas maltophilia]MDT3468927.1 portal protein [Stenotrophomonas maltophilia]